MALLSIKDLTFTYPFAKEPSLTSLNLEVQPGDFVGITGSVASGKSTLLRLLKPELQPTGSREGEIVINGEPLESLSMESSATAIGFVQQNPSSQLVTSKVWTELAFGLENRNVPSEEIRSRVAEMSHYFGLNHWFEQDVQTLSLGQKQLVNLAATVILRPSILILDEPTAHLDPIAATEFRQTLVKLNQELHLTIILVEHQLDELMGDIDRLVVLKAGHIALNERPQDLSVTAIREQLDYLPLSMTIFASLAEDGAVPLTLKAGWEFLQAHFKGSAQVEAPVKLKPAASVLQVKHLFFAYERDQVPILKDLSLSLGSGEIFTLVGSNGVGKSTLLKVLAGILRPQKGKIRFKAKKIAYLPQEVQALFLGENLLEDLELVAQQLDLSSEVLQNKLTRLEPFFSLDEILSSPLTDLSGGQLQLAALLKTLFMEGELLLLDEPTKGLDSQQKKQLGQCLQHLAQAGKTILIVSHDLDFAAEVSHRCGLFFQGDIIGVSQPRQFFQQHYFYTTTAHRLGRDLYPSAITPKELLECCLAEGRTVNGQV